MLRHLLLLLLLRLPLPASSSSSAFSHLCESWQEGVVCMHACVAAANTPNSPPLTHPPTRTVLVACQQLFGSQPQRPKQARGHKANALSDGGSKGIVAGPQAA
jgi:hypothetical protein